MKKKKLVLLLAVICVISCSACAGREGNRTDSSIPKETETVGAEAAPDTKAEETDAEETDAEETDAEEVVQESPLGYAMTYDPTVFTLDDTGEADIFTYNTAEALDAPVYISVQSYPDMDAGTLAQGLALQSGMDGVEVCDARFGAYSIESKSVYIEREAEGTIQVFYAIPVGEGSLLVETGTYAGVPEEAEQKVQRALGTFTLTAGME